MRPLNQHPKIKLSRLRDIGWSLWDPIGLLDPNDSWDRKDNMGFADEYDSYLMNAAGRLRRGAPDQEVVDYLVEIETNHMGLEEKDDTRKRAQAVVKAIQSDDELWNFGVKHNRSTQ